MSEIAATLNKRFSEHRIIFWYNKKQEEHIEEVYNEIAIKGVEKIHVDGDEFAVKYRINKAAPGKKFLLYFSGPPPAYEDNWLLDMELAHYVFHTDQEALLSQKVGLDYHYKELVGEHIEFFKSKERQQKIMQLLHDGDEHEQIRNKMLAVVFGLDHVNLDTFIHAFGTAFIKGNETPGKDLERFQLQDFFWNEVARKYNYRSDEPTIYGFILEIFRKNFVLAEKSEVAKESKILLVSWKNTFPYRDSFSEISDRVADDLGIAQKLETTVPDDIMEDDLFIVTNKKIIGTLAQQVSEEAISKDKITRYVKQRENKFWYESFKHYYACIQYAAVMIALVRQFEKIRYSSLEEGTKDYAGRLYEVDQAYRKFIWNFRQSNQGNILSALAGRVEKVYVNDWLLNYNNNWQKVVDELEAWPVEAINSQRQFFNIHVKPVLDKKQRVFVVISDALRYECGEELLRILQAEKYFKASLDFMVSSLPSYTQLGMASLLPHRKLQIDEKNTHVRADGLSSAGIAGRKKILEKNSGVRAIAISAAEFMEMKAHDARKGFVKAYDLIYIYHDQIDSTGHNTKSEERVFDAVEAELEYMRKVVQKIGSMNGTNIFITADHGFIYQNQKPEESDFINNDFTKTPWKKDRRFVIGKTLAPDPSARHFTGTQLGLNEAMQVMIPKSINRLRVSASCTRFVHGGATLQEVVIPLLRVTKKKVDTTTQVDIDIIKSTNRITTNIMVVSFIQAELATDTILPRNIRAAFYAEDGEILSDQFVYNFDVVEGSERQREVRHRFTISSKANTTYKNQRVKLVLEEPTKDAAQWKHYKEYLYTLNVSIGGDFDF